MLETFDSDKYKQTILDVLVEIHDFCVANNIHYYLLGGTLLGAVRHKGFIPWDDDIDICMSRADYKKFCSMYVSENNYIISIDQNQNYYLPYAKVCSKYTKLKENVTRAVEMGAYVDVFPLDKCPGDYEDAVKFVQSTRLWRKALTVKNITFSKSRAVHKSATLIILKCICMIFSKKRLVEIISKKCAQYSDIDDYAYVAEVTQNVYGSKEIYKREWFENSVLLDFEGHKFFAPIGYKDVLKTTFGDYMTMPPVEQRKTTHSFVLL